MTPGQLLPLLLVMGASYCAATAESDVSSALNKDYVGKNILPDLSEISLESVPEPHRQAAEQFKALWDEHLTGVKDYDVVKGKCFSKSCFPIGQFFDRSIVLSCVSRYS